jgi:hypothetical protein
MPVCLHLDEDGEADRSIDPALAGTNDPWAPTLDHIVPQRIRHSYRFEDLRAAHCRCNQADAASDNDDRMTADVGMTWERRRPGTVAAAVEPGVHTALLGIYDQLRQAERDERDNQAS